MPRQKATAKARLSLAEGKMFGAEPVWLTGERISDIELTKAYNWYNYVCEPKDSKKYTIDYLRKMGAAKQHITSMNTIPENAFGVVGWLSRISVNGGILPPRSAEYLKARLVELFNQAKAAKQSTPETTEVSIYKPSVQEKTREITSSYIAELEDVIDRKDYAFDPYKWMTIQNMKALHAKRIADKYAPLLDELNQVVKAKKGSDLAEAYGFFNAKDFKGYFVLISKIVNDAKRMAGNLKKERAPRVKKTPSLAKILSKIKYKIKDDQLRIASVDPTKIIGASQVWVYNTKTRFLGVYHVMDNETLNIKGTSIVCYDEKRSVQKKLRKPEAVLKQVLGVGKVGLRTVLSDVNSKEKPLSGRLNKDTMIIRIV